MLLSGSVPGVGIGAGPVLLSTEKSMPLSAGDRELSRLNRILREWLPPARLCRQSSPLLPELRLWLLADTLGDSPLDEATINRLMDAPPYWSFCWASGQVLARWLLENPATVRDRTLVDLGSGCGVVALAAAQAGAARVIACDLDEHALAAVRVNARENGLVVETVQGLEECPAGPDLFTAADILYDRDNLALLSQLRQRGEVLLADSRIPELDPPGYLLRDTRRATTWPDLDEAGEFGNVRLFHACGGSTG